MAKDATERTETSINRRRALQAIGAATAAGLAGCGGSGGDGGGGGDGGDGGTDLGERVPTLGMEWWSSLGGVSGEQERSAPVFQRNLKERLGVELELLPTEWATNIQHTTHDERTSEFHYWSHSTNLIRLDPDEMTRRFAAHWAGNNGRPNPSNYVNCEYTYNAVEQATAGIREEREEYVYSAQEQWSQDMAGLPVYNAVRWGAFRTDKLEIGGVGEQGLVITNPLPLILSETKPGVDQIVQNISGNVIQTSNFPTIQFLPGFWNRLVHSPLKVYNQNFKLIDLLAESVETTREGRRVTVALKDATFHNGDPITSEDVKFTFELLKNNVGSYPYAGDPPYTSIEVVDDKTTEFNLESPFPSLITKEFALWGILHSDTWAPAMDDPDGFQFTDPWTGSGPFRMTGFNAGQNMQLTPHDGHPVYSPGHNVFLQAFADEQAIVEALIDGEVHIAPRISSGAAERINQEASDVAEVQTVTEVFPRIIYPTCSFSATKFREFRHAAGAVMNRQMMNDLGVGGASKPQLYATPFLEPHEWRAPEDRLVQMTDSPQGSEEQGRQILRDAGWGWDDQGRLHYPPGADLNPLWPKGEVPTASKFPCVTEDGSYKADYQP